MTPRGRRLVAPLAVGAAAVAGFVYVGAVDPNQPGHYPLCPTQALTGLDCPGCGGLRCVHSLARGDLVGALDHNALAVLVLLPLAVVAWAVWVRREWRGPERSEEPAGEAAGGASVATVAALAAPARVASTTGVWALVALMTVFTVARNVDAVPWLAWLGSGVA